MRECNHYFDIWDTAKSVMIHTTVERGYSHLSELSALVLSESSFIMVF